MILSTINLPFVFNVTAASLPPDETDFNPLNNSFALNPADRWLSRLSIFINKALGGKLIDDEVPGRLSAYETEHGITLDGYPKELLQFEQAWSYTVKVAGGTHILTFNRLRALSDVLTDEAFLTTLGCDLETPYAGVIDAIAAATPSVFTPLIQYSNAEPLYFTLGVRDNKLQFTQIVIGDDPEVTGRTLLDYTDETILVDPAGLAVNGLITASVPFHQQKHLEASVERWITFINTLSTPVEVAALEDVSFDKTAPKSTQLGSIHQSYHLADGTLLASYPTNFLITPEGQEAERAVLVLAFVSSHALYICSDHMSEEFINAHFPTFLSSEAFNADIGGYLIDAKNMVAAERMFERFIERPPEPVPVLNGGW